MKDDRRQTPDIRQLAILRLLVLFFIYSFIVFIAAATAFIAIRDMQTQTRGVIFGTLSPTTFGVNADLDQYSSDSDLRRALQLIHAGGFKWVRQHFYWKDIEPRQGEFQWDQWDRIVARANEQGLQIVAVLDTAPVWARDPGEADLATTPPARAPDYAEFVRTFTERYGDRVRYVELWDNPNVHPFWGRRNADPFEYAVLLRAGALAARAANPQVKIISAGLAPSTELIRGHPDYSDILFLRGMYDAGAREYFDIVGAKPYGMWSGPEDRRVAPDVFNFSRAILLHDELVAHGDAAKPMWAVEFGWNALPKDWRGAPSLWGTDTEEVQSARLSSAIQRARGEWPWMAALIAQTFQPHALDDDPLWGFALVDKNFQPRKSYASLSNAIAAPVQPATFDFPRFYAALAVLGMVALVAAWRGAAAASRVPWSEVWRAVEMRFVALPEGAQFALLLLAAFAFYYSPNVILNFALLVLLVFLFALRLDYGLAITVFAIPFYLLPKTLFGSFQFSMVEILTLVTAAAWGIRRFTRFTFHVSPFNLKLETVDLAVLFFVLVGLLSVNIAPNFGVANREFRVVVIEPALMYALMRASNLARHDLQRLVDAFILSALAVSLFGLYQFLFTDYVIVGEGVRRILAVYGSPNNLALYLDRVLPLLVALVLFVEDYRRRAAYALVALPIMLCLYLTYSRGAWLVGLPAGLLFIGLVSGKRARIAMAALLVAALIVLVPFLQTERFQSFFQTGTGTAFFRISVWESATAMIRDHPIFGVGLDNFLYEYPKYIKPAAWREPNLSHPHNIVLDFWVRMGILGLVALGWIVFEFYRRGFRKIAGVDRAFILGLLASMTAALAHGMIDAAYFYVDLAFGFMLMLGLMVESGDS